MDSESVETRLFLCGDVMTGRGVDQSLPHPVDPVICEPYVHSALTYVRLAEQANGPVPRPVPFDYIWGDALSRLALEAPDARIVNLETSVTARGNCSGRGISYRMNPANLPCLKAAGIDICGLANNHVLDWGLEGFLDTLDSLRRAGFGTAGAGRDLEEAAAPAVLGLGPRRRVLVFAAGTTSSGIPADWAAAEGRPGVNVLPALTDAATDRFAANVGRVKRAGDVAIASLHWGGNWGYEIPPEQRRFAHGLIDRAGVDIVHGHSSHHVKGIEVYRERLILYGCGDFLNDYEGISGYEQFRDDLTLMYFPTVRDGRLVRCRMIPMRIRNLRLNRASRKEAVWLRDTLNREGAPLGTSARLAAGDGLDLEWG